MKAYFARFVDYADHETITFFLGLFESLEDAVAATASIAVDDDWDEPKVFSAEAGDVI